MTDAEIKKALGCCSRSKWGDKCAECFYLECDSEKGCRQELCEDAIDLINRQQAEIERLKSRDMQVEVSDMLEKEIKAEAIKEFWRQRPPQLNPNTKGKEQYSKGWNDCISFFAEEYEVFFGVKERDVKEMVGGAE